MKDFLNYGLYIPPVNERAGKFLIDEKLIKDYSLASGTTLEVSVVYIWPLESLRSFKQLICQVLLVAENSVVKNSRRRKRYYKFHNQKDKRYGIPVEFPVVARCEVLVACWIRNLDVSRSNPTVDTRITA